MAVSLMGKPRIKCLAAYDGEVLVIHSMEQVSGFLKSWKAPLLNEIKTRQDQGFDVLIEERTEHFRQVAPCTTFDTVDDGERRTILNIALDHYFALTSLGDVSAGRHGNIVFGKGLERYALTSNTVDVDQDDKGRNRYNIAQDQFTGYHRAMLLAVLNAMVLNPLSDRYIDALFSELWEAPGQRIPPTLAAITTGVDQARMERLNKQYG